MKVILTFQGLPKFTEHSKMKGKQSSGNQESQFGLVEQVQLFKSPKSYFWSKRTLYEEEGPEMKSTHLYKI